MRVYDKRPSLSCQDIKGDEKSFTGLILSIEKLNGDTIIKIKSLFWQF